MRTVIAVFEDRERAHEAVEHLESAGFDEDRISYLARGDEREDEVTEGAAAGATAGAILGGLAGLLVATGTLIIPGLGLVAVGGPVAGLLGGAAAGAVAGGIIGALVDLGIPEEEAEAYAEAVRRGYHLVAVETEEERARNATTILASHEPVDLKWRAQVWREEGWVGFDEEAQPFTEEEIEHEREMFRERR